MRGETDTVDLEVVRRSHLVIAVEILMKILRDPALSGAGALASVAMLLLSLRQRRLRTRRRAVVGPREKSDASASTTAQSAGWLSSQTLYLLGIISWALCVVALWVYSYSLWTSWRPIWRSLVLFSAVSFPGAFTLACIGIVVGVENYVDINRSQGIALGKFREFLAQLPRFA